MKLLILSLLVVLAGCTYNVNLERFNYGTRIVKPFKGKKVAIVVPAGAIEDGHKTQSDVHTYSFQNVEKGVIKALQNKLEAADKVTVMTEVSDGDYDYYLYPNIRIRSVNDFWTMGCLIKYRLSIKDKNKKLLAEEQGEGKRNFFDQNDSEKKCKIAMAEVFDNVTKAAVLSM
ncbi:MAG: hypothetical protein HRT44_09475 [Bdellovibrionales bacterium]|nr:hypothetical protein [Bdellovibrionales bacterium]NQZ19470.1 hypothetical protein [Bdellovibrionales bacterium]